jgi:hypothetical protein
MSILYEKSAYCQDNTGQDGSDAECPCQSEVWILYDGTGAQVVYDTSYTTSRRLNTVGPTPLLVKPLRCEPNRSNKQETQAPPETDSL